VGRSETPRRSEARVNLALFDSSSLLGERVKAHLVRRKFPAGEVRLFDTGAMEEGGNVTEFGGEARLAVRPGLDEMDRIDLAFFCGEGGSGRPFLEWPRQGRFTAIDLTRSANPLEEVPVVNAGVNPEAVRTHHGLLASPHPVAQFLSTFLAPLHRGLSILEVTSVVMQPVSESGQEGIEELVRQTAGLLNFGEVPQERLGRVLAFNLVPTTLDPDGEAEERAIVAEVAGILGGGQFAHALKVLRVPVFHCHSMACHVNFARPVTEPVLREILAGERGLRLREGAGGATPAELAGEEAITVGEIRPDPSTTGGVWFWGVGDNLATGVALNAVRIAEALLDAGRLGGRSVA
jgi:aspartate-semialdehyde dehydrogenase